MPLLVPGMARKASLEDWKRIGNFVEDQLDG